jgi:enoyl-CoA hydratase/carnithine racemase
MRDYLEIRRDGAVLEITFAHPEKRNALSNTMYRAATPALNAAQKDASARVVRQRQRSAS